ncbi:BrnT family toxin [Janthinobacterium sp. EB271-G4-7A]|uniref:BrnT family toxin n=1 Tax=Janthinobacterium sp. EB271-G4-7A TaxID=2775056 RepID=UPI001E3423BB|nr:BrnT family toxin [Janthinobacterium sp. EB271-G4-7A]MCC7698990.1 BrnT family toxin [Janthinobacterium sp. EB271-G4-7A]
MRITFDAVKREKTLRERGLDFARARVVFDELTITLPDQRQDYGEPRFITAGWLDEPLIVLVWAPRGRARRIISMWKANEREIDKYKQSLG